MIVNCELLIEYLAEWLAEYAKRNHKKLFVTASRLENRNDYLIRNVCAKATTLMGGLRLETRTVMKSLDEEYLECHRIADKNSGIVVGPVDQSHGLFTRKFGKRSDGGADVFPLFNVEYSEIVQVTDELWDSRFVDPTGYEQYEFCNKTEAKYGIITAESPPHKHARWPYFTADQKRWIADTHQREKKTRHKKLMLPFPYITNKPQLCRRSEL